ncbi:MAG: Cna B-type domain-containing protein [Actinomycetaceae bacterium]|nr:Cna B-type domain-containing protein [Actinomycetaceae bacterium]
MTSLEIQNLNGQTLSDLWYTASFHLAMKWDASANGANLHEGDYFTIDLPDQMVFPTTSSARDFNLYADDGETVIAKAHVDPTEGGGGKVTVTFTDYVEGRENIKGNIRLGAQLNTRKIVKGEDNTFTVSVNGGVTTSPTSINFLVRGEKDLENEYLNKWGERVSGNANEARWVARINHTGANLTNVVISDRLSEGDGSETYIADSFQLVRVDMDSKGFVIATHEAVDLTNKITIAPDGRSFTINVGNISGGQYRLTYRSSYTPPLRLRNAMTLTSTERSASFSGSYQVATSGGSGDGNLANKIKLTKVDAEDNSVTLAGAVFEVTAPNGSTFQLTTGTDGTVTSESLTSGTYTAKEVTAPSGYELNDQVFTLNVSPSGGALQTVTDKPKTTAVSVTKKWVGPVGDAVTVRLLADGAETDKTLTLDAASNWTGSFDDLRAYNAQGKEITYTVTEAEVSGVDASKYTTTVEGNAADGFTVTNTNAETISVSVTKKWVGPVGDAVTVRLLADGAETDKTLTLDAAGNWTGSFDGLAKYKADGSEIAYTVTEAEVSGVDASKYTSTVEGSAADGFTVTNTNAETISVPVTKTWDDDSDRDGVRPDSLVVRLKADGNDTGKSVTLDAAGDWKGSFDDLAKYNADGTEVVYTVTEDAVPEYSTSIDGFDITNAYTPGRTSVTVSKAWDDAGDQDGVRPTSIQVQLYANGQAEGDPVTLNADNQWTHTWKELHLKDAGKTIDYTVQEVDTPTGYTVTVSGDATEGYTLTNAHTPETVSIPVTKKWEGETGPAVTIHLLADGEDTGKTLTLSADNEWSGSFADLDKFAAGKEITYTVAEDDVAGYTSEVTGSAADGFTVTNTIVEQPPTQDPSTPADEPTTADPSKSADPSTPAGEPKNAAPSTTAGQPKKNGLARTGVDTTLLSVLVLGATAAGIGLLGLRRRFEER